jgi:GT2 family glycosyltransferase
VSIDLSIIIVNYNTADYVLGCLESIKRTKGDLGIEIFVVDNASVDNSVQTISHKFPETQLIVNQENTGFPAANNQALLLCKGRFIMLLNPDTVVLPESMQQLIGYMEQHLTCGITGPLLVDGSGKSASPLWYPTVFSILMHALRITSIFNWLNRGHKFISGACLVLRSTLITDIGLLDDSLFWCEDADYCWRAMLAGWKVEQNRSITVIHYGGKSGQTNVPVMRINQYLSKVKYIRKHASWRSVIIVKVILVVDVVVKVVVGGIMNRIRLLKATKVPVNIYKHLVRAIINS